MELNEFLQSEVEQKLSSNEKFACLTVIADKKIISVFCAIILRQQFIIETLDCEIAKLLYLQWKDAFRVFS